VSPPPGLGTDVRLQSGGLHASALLDGDAVVHLAVFPG
jgi:hypothetical protein